MIDDGLDAGKLHNLTSHALRYPKSPLTQAVFDAKAILRTWADTTGIELAPSRDLLVLGELIAFNMLCERGFDQGLLMRVLGAGTVEGEAMADMLAELERTRGVDHGTQSK